MLNSIVKKEWIKLKSYFIALIVLIGISVSYFWFNLHFTFNIIEPETVMWYRFSQLDDRPYDDFKYLFLFISVVISFAQFLPEMIQNRIKIMTHLPQNIYNVLFSHLFIGILFIVSLCLILSFLLLMIVCIYYPSVVLGSVVEEFILNTFLSIVSYLFLSSIIIDKNKIVSFVKFVFFLLFLSAFFKDNFESYDYIFVLLFVLVPCLTLDSLYSVKEQRIKSIYFRLSLVLMTGFLIFNTYNNYKINYKKEFNAYFIFYSNILKEFVYKKNLGDHIYEYGTQKDAFSKKEYEDSLPFVFWRNLDIQKKLPAVIDGIEYDKQFIKNSRLSFTYYPKYLHKQTMDLYPLFNPQSNKGTIGFPDEMFTSSSSEMLVYQYHDKLNEGLSKELTELLNKVGISYPILKTFGKTTNMKPYDKGYLFVDSKNKLFNMNRYDNKFYAREIIYPKSLDIEYIHISENRKRIFAGYAIGKDSSFYLLSWDLKFQKIDLKNFNHKTMKLKVLSNPINYLIRYDDGTVYHADVLDKNLTFIKSVSMKR